MIVNIQLQRPTQMVFDQLAEPGFTAHDAGRRADDVVAVRQQTGETGGRGGQHVQDVPRVVRAGQGRPLQG